MGTNNFLPFCPTDTGTNLLDQADYLAASDRTNGNQPGVASSKLVNKAIRQSSCITSQVAQYVADTTGANVLDTDGVEPTLLAQLRTTFLRVSPVFTKFTSGSGTWNASYQFFMTSANATAGATYTNNGVTYTVTETIASGSKLIATGNSDPTVGGTLTKTGGTGDTTITFFAFRKPLYRKVTAVGAGGGGDRGGTTGGSPTAGGNSTLGSTVVVAGGGAAAVGVAGGAGGAGSFSLGSGFALPGGAGQGGMNNNAGNGFPAGGNGGSSYYGGSGRGIANGVGTAGGTNTGAGGAGGGITGTASHISGGGGGSGSYTEVLISAPVSTYAYAVGAGGTAGTGGDFDGGSGGSGLITITEFYQ